MIDTKDVSVVVQGVVDSVFTSKVLKSIRKHFPKAEILLSTWEGTDVSGLDYDAVIVNKDPGASDMSPWEKNNVKRQIVSSYNGIKKTKGKYVLKIRSDIELRSVNFLKYFDKFDSYDKEWHFLNGRIIVPSMVSRDPRIWESPMCPSDWCSFGFKDDMLTLWDSSLPTREEEDWFLNKEKPPSVNMCYSALQARYNPEQTIWINLVKKFKPVHADHMFDINPQSINETLRSFANNLIIISEKQFGIRFLKKDRPGSDRWHVITYKDFTKIYNEYANGKMRYPFIDMQRLSLLKYMPKSNKRLLRRVRDHNESMKSFFIKEIKYAFPFF
jgi:hypothetical protein